MNKKFFYRGGDFQPPYLYMAIFIGLTCLSFIFACLKIIDISFAQTCIVTFTAAFSALVALYNWDTKNKAKSQEGALYAKPNS